MGTSMQGAGGRIRTLEGDFAPAGARPVELVFRSVGERTSALALELAIEHVRPQRVHVIEGVEPFALAVQKMLELPHVTDPASSTSHVVHVDADCLILEDLRPFLDANALPYVDCYVHDRFRGRIHCGVHITRVDVLRAMARVSVPKDDLPYVLRPESRLRNLALAALGLEKQLKTFHILHDHFQRFTDIFAKYALRELRSRTSNQRKRLVAAMADWGEGADLDVARAAVAHAAQSVPPLAKPRAVESYIASLRRTSEVEVARLGLPEQPALTRREVDEAIARDPALAHRAVTAKVFGIGLSRTGARSLTAALHMVGIDVIRFPTDQDTLRAIARDDGVFPLLEHYDGITDLTTVPYVEALARAYPDARFVLTTRDEASWLRSCKKIWRDEAGLARMRRLDPAIVEAERMLRARVYGSTSFDAARFLEVRRAHHARVETIFRDEPHRLLRLDLPAGDGWERLAPFLGVPTPTQPFPHKGRKTSDKLANLEIDD